MSRNEVQNINVGHEVRVIDWGHQYTTNIDYFKNIKDSVDIEIVIRYAYDDNSPYNENRFRDTNIYNVLYADDEHEMALIALPGKYSPVYLVDYRGLSPLPIKLTKSQIEGLLGYPIDIIEESANGS